jgi:hypothetical protein
MAAAEPANALEIVLSEVGALLQPILLATQGPTQRDLLFASLGWDLDAITGLPIDDIGDTLSDLGDLIEALGDGSLDTSDFPAILDALQHAGQAIATVEAVDAAITNGLPEIPAGALAVDFLNFMVLRYLHERFPKIFALLQVATLIDTPADPRPAVVDQITQLAVYDGRRRPALRLDRLPRLFTEPDKLFKEVYWPLGFDTQAHADDAADRIFPRLAALVTAFGGTATYGVNPATGLSFGPGGDPLVSHMLTLSQPLPSIVDEDGMIVSESVALTAGLVAGDAADPDPGVVLLPSASAEFVGVGGAWLVDVAVSATAGGFLITKAGVFFAGSAAEVDAAVTVEKLPGAQGAAVLIGSRDGTHFSIGTIVLSTAAEINAGGVNPELGFDLLDAELVIKAGDGDGFLKSVLPPDGMRMPLKFGMSWSPKTGVVFHGGATLEIDLPIDLDLTFVKIPVVHLSLGAGIEAHQDPKVSLGVAATVELDIGPVYASVEQMGVAFVFTFPERGGNLGPLNMALGFKPPKGLSLSVDAGPVSGGGYLFADYDKGEYAGVLHLDIAGKVSVTAVGLLNTKYPDGSEGFSLVVLISAEFPPIQLGYGFSLNGIGGLVGINRSMSVPALQDGIRRGAIGSLLFPVDPIPRARQIVADVGAIFPPTRDQFVVGPMIKLGWGQGLLTGTIAVIIQFPALKIALLGRVQVEVPPVEEAAIVVLRLDFAGIVDVPAKTISFDGSLDGSRVAVFTITGDIALRAGWGEQPNFALSGGGWYPGYDPPPGFPPLRRLAISLATGDNPRLRLEQYFAITPATLQFGGLAEFYYSVDIALVGLLEVDAGASFDALITFPSDFVAHFNVHVLLRRNHEPFIGVELDVRLTGAEPIVIDGKASLHWLGTHEIPFHKQLGGEPQVPELTPVDLLALVLAALGDVRSWSAEMPAYPTGVRLRDSAAGADQPLRLHPLGTLAVHQTVAPLDVTLEKAGDAPISGPKRLELISLDVAGVTIPKVDLPVIKEHFAVSQFFSLSDQQRVTQPPFERMQAGVKGGSDRIECTAVRGVTLAYEDCEIPADPEQPKVALGITMLDPELIAWTIDGGPAAARGVASKAERRFTAAPIGIEVARDEHWALADPHAATASGRLTALETYATAAEAHAAARKRDVVVTRAGETNP